MRINYMKKKIISFLQQKQKNNKSKRMKNKINSRRKKQKIIHLKMKKENNKKIKKLNKIMI